MSIIQYRHDISFRREQARGLIPKPSPARLEALSDGVIAVIITIMVLEFKVPKEPGPGPFFHEILPTLAVYIVSFVMCAIYWINHHHLISRIKTVDANIVYANFLLLFCLSLVPFAASYTLSQGFSSFAVSVYGVVCFLTGSSFLVLSVAITKHFEMCGGTSTPYQLEVQQAEFRKTMFCLALYAATVPLAYIRPWIGMLAPTLVTPLWIIPGFLLPKPKPEDLDPGHKSSV